MTPADLLVQFESSQPIDDGELDRLARRLNRELRQEDIASELPSSKSAEGSKSELSIAIGAVAIKIAPTLLPMLIERVRRFLARSPDKAVKVKIKMGGNNVELEYPSDKPLSTADVSALVKSLTSSTSDSSK